MASLAFPAWGAEEGKSERAPERAQSRLSPFCVSGHCGLVDADGNWQTAPRFSRLVRSRDYWVAHRASGLVGLLDANGRLLIAPSFVRIGTFSDGLAPAQGTKSENTGFIRPDGTWAIEARYSSARPFSEGVALVASRNAETGSYAAEFIDPAGRRAIKRTFSANASQPGFRHGLMVVDVENPEDVFRSALINRAGEFIVPPRDDQTIEVGRDGAILVRTGDRFRLIDRNGKKLFEVSGEEASLNLAGDGLAFFSPDEKRAGMVNARTGAVVIPPTPLWVSGDAFSEGLAHVRMRQQLGSDELGEGYIDRTGKVKIPPVFATAGRFRGGIAIVTNQEGDAGTIDRSGAWVSKPLKGRRLVEAFDSENTDEDSTDIHISASYETFYEEPRPFAAETAESVHPENMPLVEQLLEDRRTAIAAVGRHPCGIEIAVNREGQRIWPENLVGHCARKQLSDVLHYDEEKLSPKALSAYKAFKKEESREKAEWPHEVSERDRYSGNVEEMMTRRLYPEKAERDADLRRLIENAGWENGKTTIPLGGPLSLAANGQWKVLSSEKVTAWREQGRRLVATPLPLPKAYRDLQEAYKEGKVTQAEFLAGERNLKKLFPDAFKTPAQAESQQNDTADGVPPIPTAFVMDHAERWQAIVSIVDSGHFRLPDSPPTPESILDTLRQYGFWRNTDGLSMVTKGYSTYSWISEPRIDREAHSANWAFRYSNLSTGTTDQPGYSSGVVATVAVMGRTHTALLTTEWHGPFSEALAQTYFDEIVAVGRNMRFAEGQGYADYQAGDKVANASLERLITGEPPENYKAFSRSVKNMLERDEAERRENLINAVFRILGVAAAGAASVMGARRIRKSGESK